MASRRKLKKTIKFVCSELISEVFFRHLLSGKSDEEAVNNLVLQISDLGTEYTKRCNRPTGKDNPVLVKEYFRSLYKSWNEKVREITGKFN